MSLQSRPPGIDLTNRHAEVAALSFPEALALIGEATGRSLQFDGTPEAYRAEMGRAGLPEEVIEGLIENFQRLAARGDTRPTGVVEAVLGRPARDFADYVAEAATRGVWRLLQEYPARDERMMPIVMRT